MTITATGAPSPDTGDGPGSRLPVLHVRLVHLGVDEYGEPTNDDAAKMRPDDDEDEEGLIGSWRQAPR